MNLFCAIDCETTGLDHYIYEIIQIAILPLNSDYTENPNIPSLQLRIKAAQPDLFSVMAREINKLDPNEGITGEQAKEELFKWFEKLQKEHGVESIVPIGQNYNFDWNFIVKWITEEDYKKIFSRDCRDTKNFAASINDVHKNLGLEVPFPSTSLGPLCETLQIDNPEHHDAFNDARVAAQVYKKLVNMMRPNV